MRRLGDSLGHLLRRGALCVVIAALGLPLMTNGPSPALGALKQTTVAPTWLVTLSRTLSEQRRLEDWQVGYSLVYPSDWIVGGQVAATEFAVGAQCRSVRIVDFEPPPNSGPGAQILQSFVQVCAKLALKGASLADFMRQVYGASLFAQFRVAYLNGIPVYQTREEGPTKTIFMQIKEHRIQVFSSVAADPENYDRREAQIEEILASFSAI